MISHHAAMIAGAGLVGFIGGVAVVSVPGWIFRDRIRMWLRRRAS